MRTWEIVTMAAHEGEQSAIRPATGVLIGAGDRRRE
jgi:hypothetical protein